MNSWVDQSLPTASIPHFNGADYATVKSEGYGREIGAFEIQLKLKFHLQAFTAASVEHPDEVEKTYSIKIINNFDNDKNQYKADYLAAYASLTKVPELNERNY